MVTWDDNRKLMAGLWPGYEASPEEKALYAERLGHRRQDWLEEALKRHRSEDHDGSHKPRLSRIIAHYDAIRSSGDEQDAPSPFRKWRATWEDGQMRLWASDYLFDSEAAAIAYARTMGGDPGAMPCGGKVGTLDDTSIHADQCEADAQQVLADMLTWDANRRKAALAYMASLGMAGFAGPISDPDDVRKWSRTARGLAHAADERVRTPVGKAQYAKLAGSTPAWTREKQ